MSALPRAAKIGRGALQGSFIEPRGVHGFHPFQPFFFRREKEVAFDVIHPCPKDSFAGQPNILAHVCAIGFRAAVAAAQVASLFDLKSCHYFLLALLIGLKNVCVSSISSELRSPGRLSVHPFNRAKSLFQSSILVSTL